MPTSFNDLQPVRRVAVGDCSGPLGSAFANLASSAFSALLSAEWAEDSSPPFLPVHDNGQTANKSIPRGDAWKCSYGYDSVARTERSACGAVCYSFAVPSDALAGSACNVSSVSLSVTGDRYLDAGVDVHVVLDANAVPPSIATLAARTPDATVCATSSQTEPPNQRHGITASVNVTPGTAATAYIHVALLLHDYPGTRGAWIEGGAMLDDARATIVFSRAVTPNARAAAALLPIYNTKLPSSYAGKSNSRLVKSFFALGAGDRNDLNRLSASVNHGAAALAASQFGLPRTSDTDNQVGFAVFPIEECGAWFPYAAGYVSGERATTQGCFAYYDATVIPERATIRLPKSVSGASGASAKIWVSVFEVADVSKDPPWSDISFWMDGSRADCIGYTSFVATDGDSDYHNFTLSRKPSTPFVGLLFRATAFSNSFSSEHTGIVYSAGETILYT